METQISVSSKTAEWLYTEPAFGRIGRSVADNNFAKEKRNWIAILLREIFQNGLDARRGHEPVRIRIKEVNVNEEDRSFVGEILPAMHIDRFKKSVPHIEAAPSAIEKFLIVEDFGTSGLTGTTDDSALDGVGENWNAFWFREGE